MDELIKEELAKYVTLTELAITDKSEIYLVKNSLTNKIYVKKQVGNYNVNVYKTLKDIDSIYVPEIYELFEKDDKLIIIEEFINGTTLEEIRSKDIIMNEKKVINYMISLCDALDKLQKLDPPIIHKDIKPSNIIISTDGVLKLIDFDASKLYKGNLKKDTTILGTKGYASPELICFNKTDIRSDIYSIGVLMNVLTIGEYPENMESLGRLKPIIKKCVEMSPDARYQNAAELKESLENVLSEINDDKTNSMVEKNNNKINADNVSGNKPKKINKLLKKITHALVRVCKLIPGFRTLTPWKIIMAILWYMFIGSGLFIQPIVAIMLLLLSLLYTNFLNLKNKLPLLKSKNIFLKIFGYLLYTFVIFMGLGAFLK